MKTYQTIKPHQFADLIRYEIKKGNKTLTRHRMICLCGWSTLAAATEKQAQQRLRKHCRTNK